MTASKAVLRVRALSIRARIAVWYTCAFALLMAVTLGSGYLVLAEMTLDDVDDFLLESAGAVGSSLREALPVEAPAAPSASVSDGERRIINHVLAEYEFGEMGVAVFADLPRHTHGESSKGESARGGGALLTAVQLASSSTHPFGGAAGIRDGTAVAMRARDNARPERETLGGIERVVAVPVMAAQRVFIIGVSQSLARQRRTLAHVREAIFVGLPLVLVLAGAGGYVLARASLQPVEAMREQAERIGERTLSARLPGANSTDELGRLSRTFNGLLDRIEAVFEHRKRFMADASHELRTPVAVLTAEAELALQQPSRSTAEYRAALASMQAEARRLGHIVDDLFLLARGDAAERELVRSDLYLEELLADCVDSISLLARRKAITMRFAPSIEAPYRGDEPLLRRMLVNLLENAVKYTPRGGAVTASIEALADGTIRLAIEDTGIGIAPEHQARVFDRFYRVRSMRQDGSLGDVQGAGLGLPIASWIANLHGGALRIAGSSSRGTIFEVVLPPI